MATIKTIKKQKKNSLNVFVYYLFTLSLFVFLVSGIFVKSYNVSLQAERDENYDIISDIEGDNDSLQLDIDHLADRERIMGIVEKQGFSLNPENIFALVD